MKPRDCFGVVVRTVGLLLMLYSLFYFYGAVAAASSPALRRGGTPVYYIGIGVVMMIVGLYATLGVFLINAARNPKANLSLIWFAVWSSVVHAAIMAVQSFGGGQHMGPQMGHLLGDVPALLLVAVILSVLVVSSGVRKPASVS